MEINDNELARAVWQKILEMLGPDFDDAGCDWYTDIRGNTYIGDRNWQVSDNPIIASLVDTAIFLASGTVNKI